MWVSVSSLSQGELRGNEQWLKMETQNGWGKRWDGFNYVWDQSFSGEVDQERHILCCNFVVRVTEQNRRLLGPFFCILDFFKDF